MPSSTSDPLDSTLLFSIAERYGLQLRPVSRLTGGDECEIWLAETRSSPLIVRLSPAWRRGSQLQWTHDLMLSLQPRVPEVTAPLRALDGSTLFSHQGRPVVLYPFIEGQMLDREDPAQRIKAARLLARLHLAARQSPVACRTPALGHVTDTHLPPAADPVSLHDPALDDWRAGLEGNPYSMTLGVIHGDFYRRNLIVRDGEIRGLVDWDDAHPDFLMQEVAWSAWEFGKTPAGDDWHPDRVQAYLEAYQDAGGPCRMEEYQQAVPFIRWRLREEMRFNLAAAAAGESIDAEYMAAELRAFSRLSST